jgi:hypothetical protein
MRTSFTVLGLAICLSNTAGVWGQKPVLLKWDLTPGRTFYQQVTTDTHQVMTVQDLNLTQTQLQTFYLKWTVKNRTPDGDTVIAQTIEGVKMKLDIGGNKIEFDSTAGPPPANPFNPFFQAMIGSEFELILNKKFQVTKVTGLEQLEKKLGNLNPGFQPVLKQILSEDAFKAMAVPVFQMIPAGPVAVGDRWNSETDMNMGALGTYKTVNRYVLGGTVAGLDKINVQTGLSYVPAPPGAKIGGLPFKIISGTMTSKNSGGTILFNNAQGLLHNSAIAINMSGKLSVEIGGNVTQVELAQTQVVTVRTSLAPLLGK